MSLIPPAEPALTNRFDFDAREAADLSPKEVRGIRWKGKEYVLRQASEDANVQFTDAKIKHARMNDGKLVALSGGGELASLLLSRCLFRITIRPDGTEAFQPVTAQSIRNEWPPHYVADLFEEAKRISHIDQPAKKNKALRLKELEAELAELRALVEVDEFGNPLADDGRGGGRKSRAGGTDADGDGDEVGNSSSATPRISA